MQLTPDLWIQVKLIGKTSQGAGNCFQLRRGYRGGDVFKGVAWLVDPGRLLDDGFLSLRFHFLLLVIKVLQVPLSQVADGLDFFWGQNLQIK